MKATLKLFLLTLISTSAISFAVTPDQQRAFDLVTDLSNRVLSSFSMGPADQQAAFCALSQSINMAKAQNDLVGYWADRYGNTPEALNKKAEDLAAFAAIFPQVIANDLQYVFTQYLNLNGGKFVVDPRPIVKGAKVVGVKVTYSDAAGKTYDVTFNVNIAGPQALLEDAQVPGASLIGTKQTDYDKIMRDAYNKGLTGYPISVLNQNLESGLKFRCN